MTGFAVWEDIPEIIELWKETFGDSEEEIRAYLDLYLKFVLVYKADDKVLAMLSILPVSLKGEKGRYVYAVATLKSERGKGISSNLLEYAKEYIKKENEKFLVLVPAREELFSFYEKRGFTTLLCIEKAQFDCEKLKESEFEAEEISPEEYRKLRLSYINSEGVIEWSAESLEKIRDLYRGKFLEIEKLNAVLFAVKSGDELIIKELCCKKENIKSVISCLFEKSDCKKISAVYRGKNPFAMIYPHQYKDAYFNIAID